MIGLRLRAREGGPVLHLHAIDEYRHVSCTWMDAMGQVRQGDFLLDDLVVVEPEELLPPREHCCGGDNGGAPRERRRVRETADRVAGRVSHAIHRSLSRLGALVRPGSLERPLAATGD